MPVMVKMSDESIKFARRARITFPVVALASLLFVAGMIAFATIGAVFTPHENTHALVAGVLLLLSSIGYITSNLMSRAINNVTAVFWVFAALAFCFAALSFISLAVN